MYMNMSQYNITRKYWGRLCDNVHCDYGKHKKILQNKTYVVSEFKSTAATAVYIIHDVFLIQPPDNSQ